MSIRSRLRQRQSNIPQQKMAAVKFDFHGDSSYWKQGERVLARRQPSGKWTIMRVNQDGVTLPMMDVMVDVPDDCLQF